MFIQLYVILMIRFFVAFGQELKQDSPGTAFNLKCSEGSYVSIVSSTFSDSGDDHRIYKVKCAKLPNQGTTTCKPGTETDYSKDFAIGCSGDEYLVGLESTEFKNQDRKFRTLCCHTDGVAVTSSSCQELSTRGNAGFNANTKNNQIIQKVSSKYVLSKQNGKFVADRSFVFTLCDTSNGPANSQSGGGSSPSAQSPSGPVQNSPPAPQSSAPDKESKLSNSDKTVLPEKKAINGPSGGSKNSSPSGSSPSGQTQHNSNLKSRPGVSEAKPSPSQNAPPSKGSPPTDSPPPPQNASPQPSKPATQSPAQTAAPPPSQTAAPPPPQNAATPSPQNAAPPPQQHNSDLKTRPKQAPNGPKAIDSKPPPSKSSGSSSSGSSSPSANPVSSSAAKSIASFNQKKTGGSGGGSSGKSGFTGGSSGGEGGFGEETVAFQSFDITCPTGSAIRAIKIKRVEQGSKRDAVFSFKCDKLPDYIDTKDIDDQVLGYTAQKDGSVQSPCEAANGQFLCGLKGTYEENRGVEAHCCRVKDTFPSFSQNPLTVVPTTKGGVLKADPSKEEFIGNLDQLSDGTFVGQMIVFGKLYPVKGTNILTAEGCRCKCDCTCPKNKIRTRRRRHQTQMSSSMDEEKLNLFTYQLVNDRHKRQDDKTCSGDCECKCVIPNC